MAPEEQMTTRWPSWCSETAVSTIVERVESKGSCVFSSTMDEVPGWWLLVGVLLLYVSIE